MALLKSIFKASQLIPYYWRSDTIYKAHSPTLFNVINAINIGTLPEKLIKIHKHISTDNSVLEQINWGAVAAHSKKTEAKKVYNKSASRKWKSRVLFALANTRNNGLILDLGTNIGLSAYALALANPGQQIYTFEGNLSFINYAKRICAKYAIDNIEFIHGDINQTLPDFLKEIDSQVTFAFLDANHSKSATLQYIHTLHPHLDKHSSLLILDDIRWSRDMYLGWQSAKKLDFINVSIDYFQVGILGIKSGLKHKEHFSYLPKWSKPWQFTL